MAPVVQWLSSFSCSPVGGSPLSPLTAGQLPLAQLYLDGDEQRGARRHLLDSPQSNCAQPEAAEVLEVGC